MAELYQSRSPEFAIVEPSIQSECVLIRTPYTLCYTDRVKNWYSWGTPTGLGFWLIACGLFFLLLHYAGLMP